ncbi:MAG: FUSC family protein [Butyricicoccus pullicaecorum]|nr:FUSC family protein [Butyricicoccus pullicaecorum]MDO4668512.1 FUSC family protein [Butyricicoccus pullicaecorum]
MRFYDMLQLDAAVLKEKIHACETAGERRRIWLAMAMRALLIVLFAIIFVGVLGGIFGAENNPMGVSLFCILLGIRFVDFGYCIKDSMAALALALAILLIAPAVATAVNPIIASCIHFCAFLTLLLMTTDKPELGNGGLFGFAYVFLMGNPVTGAAFWRRAGLTVVGYLVCGAVLYFKHHDKNKEIRFHQIAAQFTMSQEKSRWQLRMALGVSLVLTLGSLFEMERFMWMGFACISLFSSYPTVNIKERVWQRILGVIVGSSIFFVIYQVIPEALHSFLGPVGGLCLGFSTDYRYKTALNCFGALMMAAGVYGIQNAVLLRIQNNILGIIVGLLFIFLYQKLVEQRFEADSPNTEQPTA